MNEVKSLVNKITVEIDLLRDRLENFEDEESLEFLEYIEDYVNRISDLAETAEEVYTEEPHEEEA